MAEIGTKEKYEIVVNGEKQIVEDNSVSYEEIIKLAFPNPPEGEVRFTVTFYGASKPEEGTLKPEKSVKIKKQGAVFNATATVRS